MPSRLRLVSLFVAAALAVVARYFLLSISVFPPARCAGPRAHSPPVDGLVFGRSPAGALHRRPFGAPHSCRRAAVARPSSFLCAPPAELFFTAQLCAGLCVCGHTSREDTGSAMRQLRPSERRWRRAAIPGIRRCARVLSHPTCGCGPLQGAFTSCAHACAPGVCMFRMCSIVARMDGSSGAYTLCLQRALARAAQCTSLLRVSVRSGARHRFLLVLATGAMLASSKKQKQS